MCGFVLLHGIWTIRDINCSTVPEVTILFRLTITIYDWIAEVIGTITQACFHRVDDYKVVRVT